MARIWAEIEALGPTAPERRLIEACKRGDPCDLGERPEAPDPYDDAPHPDRTIRAEILRYLILGGCADCQVHETGVWLMGAYVTGVLDLSYATAAGPVILYRCRIAQKITAMQARLVMLSMEGSAVPGLNAQGARVERDVFLREGFEATGEVRLSGARIGGQLNLSQGRFHSSYEDAISLQCARISEWLVWRKVSVTAGRVDLISAEVGDLADDLDSWPEAGRLLLDGFDFNRITAGFTDSHQRLDWLSRGTVWEGEFYPQPYTHLAKVLRGMGHDRGARDVLVARERLIRHHARVRALAGAGKGRFAPLLLGAVAGANAVRWGWDILQRAVIGYGHKPFRSLVALGLLWLAAILFGEMAWRSGAMVPNSDVILTSPAWAAVAAGSHPAAAWVASFPAGADWEGFNRYAWGFDVVVPILGVGQADAWAPAPARGGWGQAAWWARWGLSVAGWVVAALALAAVTGIIQRDRG